MASLANMLHDELERGNKSAIEIVKDLVVNGKTVPRGYHGNSMILNHPQVQDLWQELEQIFKVEQS